MRDDLTCWDYVPEFTGQQAALAIVGEPETDDPVTLRKAMPVLDLMRRAYEGTRRWFADAPEDGDTAPKGLLVSVEMRGKADRTSAKLAAAGAGDVRFLTWLRTPMADFDRQTFTREVLARWVQEVGASSVYLFAGLRQYNRWRRGDKRMKAPNPKELGELIDGVADRLEVLEREHQEFFERWHGERRKREALADAVDRCHRMLLTEPDTKGALFKAENILREALADSKLPHNAKVSGAGNEDRSD